MATMQKLKAQVAARRMLSDTVILLDLAPETGQAFPPFEAGAHIDMELAPGLTRQYSLLSAPTDFTTYKVAVRRADGSRGGSIAAHSLQAGQRLQLGLPRNLFRLEEDAEHSILIGGGIGATPLIAMAHRLFQLGRDFTFLYCDRNMEKAAFTELLRSSDFSPHVCFHDTAVSGRSDFSAFLAQRKRQSHLYCCGPQQLMDSALSTARSLGYDDDVLHSEAFQATTNSGDAFVVKLARSGERLTVGPDESIASVLVKAGVEIELSCEQGVCGACLTRVLLGIPDHRDLYQTDKEKAANDHMTVCCSRSRTSHIMLDL